MAAPVRRAVHRARPIAAAAAITAALAALALPAVGQPVDDARAAGADAAGDAKPETQRESPLERFNRRASDVNYWITLNLVVPVAMGYNVVIPKPVQRSVNNVIQNMERPRDLANSLMQLKWERAGRHFGSLVLNTTLGMGGLFYVSDTLIADDSPETFGETLGHWGIPAGPYLVLPVVVPPLSETTARGLVGAAGDLVMGPVFWLNTLAGVLGGSEGLIVSSSLTVTGGLNSVAMLMPGPFADESEWQAFDELVRQRTPYRDRKRLYLENKQYDVED